MANMARYVLEGVILGTALRDPDFKYNEILVWMINENVFVTKSPHRPHEFVVLKGHYWVIEADGRDCGALQGIQFHAFVAARNKFIAERILLGRENI